MYQRIEGSAWRNIWLVGDLHGCFAVLMSHLRQIKFDPYQDLLISVGDLIDRGPQSAKCLALLDCCWFCAVRGNHEQMALDAQESGALTLWVMNGGHWYQESTRGERLQIDERLDRCRQLPLIVELSAGSLRHIVAHADYPAATYRWQQPVDEQQVLWSRQRLMDHLAGRHGAIGGADHFWFGHTPLKQRYDSDNQHYIDTGAVFGGALTLVQLQ
ncbi:serine/threonine-protein phosphatase [Raoultella ornithinolytica]|uniref:protein-serine/threonine phosphatase n=1 Tax=Raoultella ornithinolytica TaxID=54291 RepID=UPI000B59863B|nr:protein-serine/threonine phosphatase [Raoultella ornithinolytica]ASI60208.1 serine/threonine-protein phosphatase [Raoultella ornithinolytica]OZV32354.1 serine/threonine-protein phosphatase [Raoultella ornithinolytica]OZV36932.1 serine/threonine-protein phosphatase [Raoultella ornithinolytica]OZV37428.1 serine/threonine-protein phosphatase [Raoultella ornithinolytica]OZV46325.1 serine/threonine-protein phosphatase [Raoultella ornithinolytica]